MALSNPLDSLNADWSELYTVEEFREQVDPDFDWQGPGWYETDTDTLYVARAGGNKYWFYVYNERSPLADAREQFAAIAAKTHHQHHPALHCKKCDPDGGRDRPHTVIKRDDDGEKTRCLDCGHTTWR